MKRFRCVLWGACGILLLAGCETLDQGAAALGALGGGQGLSGDTIIAGLREALSVGTRNTVSQTSRAGGYSQNPAIRIPMPEKLQGVASTLRKVGLGAQVDEFENRMNAAAESAAAEAAPVFVDAIRGMTFEDARGILKGGNTAATEFFQRKTSDDLRRRYAPIVTAQMQQLGVVRQYDDLIGRYNSIPLVSKKTLKIEDYVTDQALKGLFLVLGEEEKKIRQDPAARTTELLRQVFGNR